MGDGNGNILFTKIRVYYLIISFATLAVSTFGSYAIKVPKKPILGDSQFIQANSVAFRASGISIDGCQVTIGTKSCWIHVYLS